MGRDRIIIKDLLVRGILGIHPEERTHPQDILVNVVMFTDLTEAAVSGDLSRTVRYDVVAQHVTRRILEGRDFLAETLAYDLARLILAEFAVDHVLVRIEKPAAIESARAVGVEIERSRADFTTGPAGG
ncbi:MAG TPA: dihydroneopterin aldolase [Longimicrobiaceae bacterium]|nr:dihydroneopterin aldolase [Longimicrobiaceae bacterium]